MIRGALTTLFAFFLVFSLFTIVVAENDNSYDIRDINEELEPTTREQLKAGIREAVEVAVAERREEMAELSQERQQVIESIRLEGGRRTYEYELRNLEGRIDYLVEEEIITDEKGEEIVQRWISHNDARVRTRLALRETLDDKRLRVELGDGQQRDVVLLPDQAHEMARERLRAREVDVQLLEEERKGNIPRVVYHIRTEKQGKFLGIVNTRVRMNGRIDAETGEVIEISKPWWSFMVSGEDEEQEGIVENV